MRNEKEELYYNITEIPHVRVTERSKNVKECKSHRYFGYYTIKIVPKHRWKRLFNFAIVLWRDGLINSLPRYAGTSGGTRPIDSSVHRHARQVTRRGRSRNCHAQAGNMCVCVHVCILSGQERASVAGCDTCFVTWISPLVYPTTSYTQLPLETVPFPHLLPPLLHRDPSMPFEYLDHRTSQPHPAPPFFHGKPSPPRPNSCRGRNRVRALRHRISPYPSFLGLHIWIRLDGLQGNRDCLFFFSFSKWLSVVILVEIFHEIFSETLSAILSLALFTYTDTKWCLACIEERWSLLFVQAFLSFAWNLSIFHLVYIFGFFFL